MTDIDRNENTVAFVPLSNGLEIGNYRLIRKLGVGGMGEVFLAEDRSLERQVALKFLAPQYTNEEMFKQRFLREAKSAAKLNHPKIITIHEVAEVDSRVFLSMEYVDGKLLREMIDTRALDYNKALDIFLQICDGLKKAHDNEIIHRDLKPSNIMITEDNNVKILDFGLAKGVLDGNITATGTAMGTINYMSPEQTQGIANSKCSDIFSTGIIFFELLSGVNPFVRGHMPGTIHAIMYEPVGYLHTYNKELPTDAQTIVEKALAKKPEDRYQSIDEMIEDIHRLKTNKSITPNKVAQPNIERSGLPTLAVLCLQNLGSAEDDFLSYGITEDLIVDLSRIGSVKVSPMRKVLKYKDTSAEIEDIASHLNVGMILDGSIHRSGDRIRISAQLIDVSTEDILWSNRWEESQENISKIKTDFAQGISHALSFDSSIIRKADVGKAETSNPEAYEFYLKGKYALDNRKKKEDLDLAQELFKKALELVPDMYAAQVGLAQTYNIELKPQAAIEILEKALAEATKKELKADQAKIRVVYGASLNRLIEYDKAEEVFKKSIEQFKELRDPKGEAEAIYELSKVFLNTGKVKELFQYEERMDELASQGLDESHIVSFKFSIANAYLFGNDTSKAQSLLEEILQIARINDIKPVECKILYLLGECYSIRGGKYNNTSLAYIEEARYIAEQLQDQHLITSTSLRYITVQMSSGQFRSSLLTIDDVFERYKKLGDNLGQSSCVANKAIIYLYMLEYEKVENALEVLDSLLDDTFPDMHKIVFKVESKIILGHMYAVQGDYNKAKKFYNEAITMSNESEFNVDYLFTNVRIAEIQFINKEYEQAKQNLLASKDDPEIESDILAYTIAFGYLALFKVMEGKFDEGLQELRDLVEYCDGNSMIVTAKKLYGQAMYLYGQDDQMKQKGRQELMQAIGIARQQENRYELKYIQGILDKAS